MRRRVGTVLGLTAAALGVVAGLPGGPGAHAVTPVDGPVIDQLVVFRDGRAVAKRVSAEPMEVTVRRRTCAVGAATPLAALVAGRPGSIRLRDFGSCSDRARDAGGLFVSGIGPDRNRRQNGWVYKVGRRNGTAGAADPTGPFGRGRLRDGARVTWFYCVMGAGGCQRTLSVKPVAAVGGLTVTVTGYDDRGAGVPVEGATARAGTASAVTGPDGTATLAVAPGQYRVYAAKEGLVRSFAERVRVP